MSQILSNTGCDKDRDKDRTAREEESRRGAEVTEQETQGRPYAVFAGADAGDFDGDGRLDILVGGRKGAGEATGMNLLANRGEWIFAPVWLEAGEIYKTQTRARTVQVCDINCDGRADLFFGIEYLHQLGVEAQLARSF